MPTIYLCIHCSTDSFLSVWRISVPILRTHRPAGPSSHIRPGTVSGLLPPGRQALSPGVRQ